MASTEKQDGPITAAVRSRWDNIRQGLLDGAEVDFEIRAAAEFIAIQKSRVERGEVLATESVLVDLDHAEFLHDYAVANEVGLGRAWRQRWLDSIKYAGEYSRGVSRDLLTFGAKTLLLVHLASVSVLLGLYSQTRDAGITNLVEGLLPFSVVGVITAALGILYLTHFSNFSASTYENILLNHPSKEKIEEKISRYDRWANWLVHLDWLFYISLLMMFGKLMWGVIHIYFN